MTKDRIKDLQKTTSWSRASYKRIPQRRTHEVQNDVNDTGNHSTTIDIDDNDIDDEVNVTNFLKQVDLLRALIDKIDTLAEDVKRLYSKMLDPFADPKLEQELDDKRTEIKKLAYSVSTKLKKMEEIQENENDNDKTSVEWRIKESQIFVVTRRFRDTMNRYNEDSDSHLERCKKIVKRQLEYSGNKKSDDEIDGIVEDGFPGTHKLNVMVESQNAIDDLNYIEARQRDIEKLEISIKELHAMFLDIALLVSRQGEMIDNIEHNVIKTVNFIGEGTDEVRKTKNLLAAATKKRIIIYIILAVVLVILIFMFISYLTQKKS